MLTYTVLYIDSNYTVHGELEMKSMTEDEEEDEENISGCAVTGK